jgi:hypothetical protein
MNTVIARNKKELILQVSLIDIESPGTRIINRRADGSETTYTFNPEEFTSVVELTELEDLKKRLLNYDKHIKKLLTSIKKIPKGYFE